MSAIRKHALRYLNARTTSSGHLRTLLERGAKKRAPDQSAASRRAEIDEAIAHCTRLGLLDDAAWARSRIASLRRQGNSTRQIEQKLRLKRIPSTLIEELLNPSADVELVAALQYLRKKRSGPWSTSAEDPQKVLARLARRGFSYDIARRAMALDLDEARTLTGR